MNTPNAAEPGIPIPPEVFAGPLQSLPESAAPPLSPSRLRARPRASTALVVLATLAVGYTLWAAQELILPILLAGFFALVGNPIIRFLQRIKIPRFIGALLVIGLGISGSVLLARQLVDPVGTWVREAPRQLRELTPQLRKVAKPMQDANKVAENIARAAGGDAGNEVQVVRTESNDPYKSLTATPKMLASVLAVVLLTLFFMVFGQRLQHNALLLLPSWQQKRLTVDIMQSIEREMSRYVLTISVINTIVGLVLAALLYFICHVPLQEALMWGTIAALLNFAPYVGPLIGVALMLVMGFMRFDGVLPSLVPAMLYLGLHTLEGQFLTPIVLGKRMAISPLILILALMVFGWVWGIIGLLLAVPLVACIKIVLGKIEGLEGWAKLME